MRKLLSLLALILVGTLLLSGCGFSSWQDDESLRAIKEIKRITDSDGNVYLEVRYTDDTQSDRFLVPKGVSIANVDSVYDSDEKKTSVTITFSEGEPYTFDIPDGIKGNSVSGVKIETFDKIKYLVFEFADADGNSLEPIKINISEIKGEDGATWTLGTGVPGTEGNELADSKVGDFYLDSESFLVYNKTADGWKELGTIKGTGIIGIEEFYDDYGSGYKIVTSDIDSDGNHVAYPIYSSALTGMKVVLNESTAMYEFIVTVTDAQGFKVVLGDTEGTKITVERPATWFKGYHPPIDGNTPADITCATINGDFYYCEYNDTIYSKSNDVWTVLIKLPSEDKTDTCTITFNSEGGVLSTNINAYPAKTEIKSDGSQVVVRVNKGECYPTTCEIPVPTRDDGYVFAGWYRKKQSLTATANINYGQFTDMVPVTADLELYAYWQKVTE